jgi:hypothetical protein
MILSLVNRLRHLTQQLERFRVGEAGPTVFIMVAPQYIVGLQSGSLQKIMSLI